MPGLDMWYLDPRSRKAARRASSAAALALRRSSALRPSLASLAAARWTVLTHLLWLARSPSAVCFLLL